MDKQEIAHFIGEKIKDYRKQKGWTQLELGKKIGLGKNAISNYEKGFRTPKKDTMFALAEAFNISIDDLFPPTSTKEVPENAHFERDELLEQLTDNYIHLDDMRKHKLVDTSRELVEEQAKLNASNIISLDEDRKRVSLSVPGKVSAGTGYWQEDDYDTMVSFYEDEIPDDDKYDTIAIVVGHSMEPKIKNGDFLFIKLADQVDINKIGIFQVNGENYVKKLKNDHLQSLNPKYADITPAEGDDFRTIGEVVDIYREN